MAEMRFNDQCIKPAVTITFGVLFLLHFFTAYSQNDSDRNKASRDGERQLYQQSVNEHYAVQYIRLLATVISRGGNIPANSSDAAGDHVNPAREVIDSWLQKNGESIYGTKASPLPLQNWGVATMNRDRLYLHVFNWPADGKLYAGGILSRISRAWFLANPSRKIDIQQLASGDIRLLLPDKAPDTINTVIVLQIKGKLKADSTYFIVPGNMPHHLEAFDAALKSRDLRHGLDNETGSYYIEGWERDDQLVSWKFRTIGPARFKVIIKYFAPEASSGGIYFLQLFHNYSAQSPPERIYNFSHTVSTRSDMTVEVSEQLDEIDIPNAGTYTLSLAPLTINKTELMKLLEIQLIPTDK